MYKIIFKNFRESFKLLLTKHLVLLYAEKSNNFFFVKIMLSNQELHRKLLKVLKKKVLQATLSLRPLLSKDKTKLPSFDVKIQHAGMVNQDRKWTIGQMHSTLSQDLVKHSAMRFSKGQKLLCVHGQHCT